MSDRPRSGALAELLERHLARLRARPTDRAGTQPLVKRLAPSDEIVRIIEHHTWAAAAAMFAIPLPGADMAATFAVWGAMIRKIAAAYGEQITLHDGVRLASELFKDAVLTGFAWFGSAKVATAILKLIPFAGTVTAYAVDAAVAAASAKKITSTVGAAAALYYGTGKSAAPRSLREHVETILGDEHFWRQSLTHLRLRRGQAPEPPPEPSGE